MVPSPAPRTDPPPATLFETARIFGTIALVSFGGGQKASVRRAVVDRFHWLKADDYVEALALAQFMPGANLVNLAVFVGYRMRGVAGGLTALAAVCIPPFFVAFAAAWLYFSHINVPFGGPALRGCAAGAVGLTIANAIELTLDRRRDGAAALLLIVATAIAVAAFKWNLLMTFALFGSVGVALAVRRERHA